MSGHIGTFALGIAIALPLALFIGDDDTAARVSSEPTTLAVELGEMFVRPASTEVEAGAVRLAVKNTGTAVHTLAVQGTDQLTPELAGGASGALTFTDLAAGSYTLVCTIAGHADAGMRATLTVTPAGSAPGMPAPGGHGSSTGPVDVDAMDELMAAPVKAFPAPTKGLGAQPLAAKILADGTKEFTLTSSMTRWEVEPGRVVDAMSYNGQVPGPTLAVKVGDRVRVVLRNELPVSTSIHFHGIRTPNAMDGVPDITQPPVKPGQTFTYAFTADRPAVGMYHSHHDAVKQVPDGLAGTFLIGTMPRPAGVRVARTLPMVLNDAGAIGFSLNGKSFPATTPIVAKLGEWIEVHYLNEGLQSHPMHLHGLDQLVTAKDGFPLPQPYLVDTINVAPGERYTVLVRADNPGVWAWHCHILSHAEGDKGMFGMVTAMIVK